MHSQTAIPFESPLYPLAVSIRIGRRVWRLLARVSDRVWGSLLQCVSLGALGLMSWQALVG